MKVIQYKLFDIEKVTLSSPNKAKECEILYDGSPEFRIQTPEIVSESLETITFDLKHKGQFLTLFENLYDKMIELLILNSKDFFNGKQFTNERLKTSLKPFVTLNEANITINNIKIKDNVKVFDVLKSKINKIPDFPIKSVSMVKLTNLKFIKSDCFLNLEVDYLKLVSNKNNYNECIFEDDYEEVDFFE